MKIRITPCIMMLAIAILWGGNAAAVKSPAQAQLPSIETIEPVSQGLEPLNTSGYYESGSIKPAIEVNEPMQELKTIPANNCCGKKSGGPENLFDTNKRNNRK